MEQTNARRLAEEYLRLGGHRRVAIDDNQVSIRSWEPEPAEAEAFWKRNVEPLAPERQREVELFLPTINRA
ncbi:hypothetical protein PYH37_000824 [Sinorhizobium numidicum]|uniref:Uncharacterized protein n=1 Tax=Sinorhizobium numidicum TaxID=680248 RepID=A0ABY8CRY6_9HYPH|nr:hypothetical protein [Sinorhizobium numidicum]WEX75413.1 hypothetical protein PYH37_000824 [Sinorhizobium numidicum]WEX81409.1 hypothetical protein PYH38_000825 [Sinorhizobium numidicum]